MEGKKATVIEAKEILGKDFIGPEELALIYTKLGIINPLSIYLNFPEIPYSISLLNEKKGDYILLLTVPLDAQNEALTLNYLRSFLGWDSIVKEPSFYNQDWYLKEAFANECTIELKWSLIKKEIENKTRAKSGQECITEFHYTLPSALLCSYVFFAYYFHTDGDILWKHDFIWCSDKDHNGDQIYVGKYIDIDGVNKNGFSIHRHLALRSCYGAVEVL